MGRPVPQRTPATLPRRRFLGLGAAGVVALVPRSAAHSEERAPLAFQVVAEEVIATYADPNNGSGPMWCYGSPTIVREGERVLAIVPETGKDAKPLCNTRWQLFVREPGRGWERAQAGAKFDEREPCPLVRLPGGRILLSVNPAIRQNGQYPDGRTTHACEPHLLEFSAADPRKPPVALKPKWDKAYAFTEHSYRGIAADRLAGEILLLNILAHEGQAWSHLDRTGSWSRQGMVVFPRRACYPQVALRNRAAHILAISDIIEPNPTWRAFKKKVTGRDWDYDFRNLYFTWTPDITKAPFAAAVTVASREETCGHIRNLDMWIGPDGDAHILYLDRNIWHAFIRNEFFRGTPITVSLVYARVREGKVVEQRTVVEHVENQPAKALVPSYAALHATADGRLVVLYHVNGGEAAGNYALQLVPKSDPPPARLPLKLPLASFFAATERLGTEPSDTIDLYGPGPEPHTIRYAQVKIR
ncbi:MAG TPA: hypothetical protein VNE39_03005 [Planctomycetota bacterium]|nr:hypothetical protein [Planctomycetota bacterium]